MCLIIMGRQILEKFMGLFCFLALFSIYIYGVNGQNEDINVSVSAKF